MYELLKHGPRRSSAQDRGVFCTFTGWMIDAVLHTHTSLMHIMVLCFLTSSGVVDERHFALIIDEQILPRHLPKSDPRKWNLIVQWLLRSKKLSQSRENLCLRQG